MKNTLRLLFLLFCQTTFGQSVSYLDSTILYTRVSEKIDTTKKIFTFWDKEGNGTSSLEYVFKNRKWNLVSRDSIYMDNYTHQNTHLIQKWHSSSHKWIPDQKTLKGPQIYATFYWDSTKQKWSERQKTEIIYSQDSLSRTDIQYWYNSKLDSLLYEAKSINTYYPSGFLHTTAGYTWDTILFKWKSYTDCEYRYQKQKAVYVRCVLNPDTLNGDTIGSQKTEIKKDSLGNLLLDLKYTWDTLSYSWLGIHKYEKLYDSLTHTTKEFTYAWDASKKKWRDSLVTFSFSRKDSNRVELIDGQYMWDNLHQKWTGVYEDTVHLDLYGNTIFANGFIWDSNLKVWREDMRHIMLYDTLGKHIRRTTYYKWDQTSQKLILSYDGHHTYQFNAFGDILVDSFYVANNLSITRKEVYTYTDHRKIATSTGYTWSIESISSPEKGSWVPHILQQFGYDKNDSLILDHLSYWSNNEWVNYKKTESSFDESGHTTSRAEYEWDITTAKWKKIKKFIDINSPFGSTLIENYIGADSLGEWALTSWTKRSYNEKGGIIHYVEYFYDESHKPCPALESFIRYDDYGHMTHLSHYGWDLVSKKQILTYRLDSYYSFHSLITLLEEEKEKEFLQLYPNPTHDRLYIRHAMPTFYKIFDRSGKSIKEGPLEIEDLFIETKELVPGTYVLKLFEKELTHTKVFVKK